MCHTWLKPKCFLREAASAGSCVTLCPSTATPAWIWLHNFCRSWSPFWHKRDFSWSELHPICTYTRLTTAESGVKGFYGDCKLKATLAEVRVRFVNISAEQLVCGSPAARYERCSRKSMTHLKSNNALAQKIPISKSKRTLLYQHCNPVNPSLLVGFQQSLEQLLSFWFKIQCYLKPLNSKPNVKRWKKNFHHPLLFIKIYQFNNLV